MISWRNNKNINIFQLKKCFLWSYVYICWKIMKMIFWLPWSGTTSTCTYMDDKRSVQKVILFFNFFILFIYLFYFFFLYFFFFLYEKVSCTVVMCTYMYYIGQSEHTCHVGPHQGKKCIRTCTQYADSDHLVHTQSICAFTLHFYIL